MDLTSLEHLYKLRLRKFNTLVALAVITWMWGVKDMVEVNIMHSKIRMLIHTRYWLVIKNMYIGGGTRGHWGHLPLQNL